MSLPFNKKKCSNCGQTFYLPFGHVDFICQCHHKDGTRKTDNRTDLKIDDPLYNHLGINSEVGRKTDNEKKDAAYVGDTPVDTYNEV